MPLLLANGRSVLFVHVPKTAGTSVEHLLRSYGRVVGVRRDGHDRLPCTPQHFHGELLEHLYGSDRAGSPFDYVFMTVRDPMRRIVSEYYYRREFWAWPRRRLGRPALNTWVRRSLRRAARDPYLFDNHLRPQHEFLSLGAEVFRIEDGLEPVRRRLDAVLGLTGELGPRLKTSAASGGGGEVLSESSRQLVSRFYARDFAEFGYDPAS